MLTVKGQRTARFRDQNKNTSVTTTTANVKSVRRIVLHCSFFALTPAVQPPMYDISIFGSSAVSAVRICE